jgi:hypothetical protein
LVSSLMLFSIYQIIGAASFPLIILLYIIIIIVVGCVSVSIYPIHSSSDAFPSSALPPLGMDLEF